MPQLKSRPISIPGGVCSALPVPVRPRHSLCWKLVLEGGGSQKQGWGAEAQRGDWEFPSLSSPLNVGYPPGPGILRLHQSLRVRAAGGEGLALAAGQRVCKTADLHGGVHEFHPPGLPAGKQQCGKKKKKKHLPTYSREGKTKVAPWWGRICDLKREACASLFKSYYTTASVLHP